MLRDRSYIPLNKNSNKKFIIGYTIFLVILIYLTILGIYLTIQNSSDEKISIQNIISQEFKKNNNASLNDSKYTIASYEDTYDSNSLNIINNYDIDGHVSTNDSDNFTYKIHFIQIEGLKNKDLQYQINEKIKQKAYTLGFNDNIVISYVAANFSNILSVLMYSNKSLDTLNIDLTTGNEIRLEDLFVSSATVNKYLTDSLYKTLAISNLQKNEETGKSTVDMSKIDTSSYEDKFMILLNNYNNSKNSLKFIIQPNVINVYGLVDNKIIDIDKASSINLDINLIDYPKEVIMYKKYLTDKSIFDDYNLGTKNITVFTVNKPETDKEIKVNRGKIQDNIFVEEIAYDNVEHPDNTEDPGTKNKDKVKDYIKKLSDDQKNALINQISNSRGAFFQRAYSFRYDPQNEYYVINITSYQAMCTLSYFKGDAFLDYIKLKAIHQTDNILIGFDQSLKDTFPNLEILPSKTEEAYINIDGEFLGNNLEEATAKQNQLKAEKLQREATLHSVPTVQPSVNPDSSESTESSNNTPTSIPTLAPTPTPTPVPTKTPTPTSVPTNSQNPSYPNSQTTLNFSDMNSGNTVTEFSQKKYVFYSSDDNM